MAPNRITPGGAMRGALFVAASLAVALALSACGDGDTTTVAIDKPADAVILNEVLARELAAVRAYDRTLPLLRGAALRGAREFRAQEQEHVDAIIKTLRGFGEKARPEEEEIEAEDLKTAADGLGFLYAMESSSIAYGLRAISHLTAPWPRSLVGSIAANQAQHLVLLRRALGADPAESIPGAFEDGTAPDPSEMIAE